MDGKKIIAVVGATGAQGGGLARAILSDSKSIFRVRALTRDVNSAKSRQLAELGAEIVRADVEDKESVKKAFDGAYGAFCVTFYWEHLSPEKEFIHAGTMAQAAKDTGVQHVIWSTLEDTRRWVSLDDDRMPTLMGKYKVPHFDAKGEANRIFTDLSLPVTFLYASFYWENFIYFGLGPKRGPDGGLAITFPLGDKKMPGMASEDIGKCAYGIFKREHQYIGKSVGIAGEHLSGEQMASALSEALGKKISYNDVKPEVYRSLGFPGAEDLGSMFQFKRDFEADFCRLRDIEVSRELNPELQTFRQWLSRSKNKIPID
jgi:uncharacterized protein YbjT (DUF2867 family)